MKRLIYLITIFLLSGIWFVSCGSYKSARKQETHIEQQDSSRQVIDFGYTSICSITSFLNSITDKKINWKLYDTNKPIEPTTGKHPLLAEGDTEESNTIKQNTNIVSADIVSLKSDGSSSSRSQEDDKREQEKQKDETTVPKQISNLIWALSSLAILVIVGLIVYKSKSNRNSCKITT